MVDPESDTDPEDWDEGVKDNGDEYDENEENIEANNNSQEKEELNTRAATKKN